MGDNRYNLRSSSQQQSASNIGPGALTTSLHSSSTNTTSTATTSQQHQHPHPQQFPQLQQQHAQAQGSLATERMPQGQVAEGGPAATAPFLKDFTLVAEAVKRVQMDAVMTEMESISL
ncbi:hypothetical protein BGW36DRAFT_298936 [Talaromyces proteolyticus]|uniref:Uncharacterized protein n=1 Tax=Talaromyces proteolyticus TaxID=1131652 RepID=A0AAD4KSE3_9EURO|nr:uncharacterized protein BGW36DRAFT_298936 [Talaromyces proteolyticus]KAH8694970.1 hypothetical protein BGW36DRAFT_298936 [Talaromyces proteolyticus]